MERTHSRRSISPQPSLLCYTLLFLLAGGPPPAAGGGPIKTVVIVVMENRSFDHMIGWMKRLNPEINGVDGSEWNPTSTSDPNAARVYFKDGAQFVDPDPGHSFEAIREQVFGSNDTSATVPPMNGFVQQAASMSANMTEAVMNGFRRRWLRFMKRLCRSSPSSTGGLRRCRHPLSRTASMFTRQPRMVLQATMLGSVWPGCTVAELWLSCLK